MPPGPRQWAFSQRHALRAAGGCPWHDMHERYGKWNSVYVRFRRWAKQGVWDTLLDTLVDLGLTADWQHMIDSTIARGHSPSTGAKRGLIRKALVEAAAALRAKSTPALTGGEGRPPGFKLTGGDVSDYQAVADLMGLPVGKPRMLLADKSYDGDSVAREPAHPRHPAGDPASVQSLSATCMQYPAIQGPQSHRAHV
ncbi:transposase [Haematospirillum sp. H1815]|uniref:transposase n=1 Tax=Haematospirillum sp. H1815 TaxID=2723108 RepID=UPI001ADE828D|nr:transposase [Haematospirillum sp. H1815]